MSDNEVKGIIETKIDESIVSAFEVLRKRIDKFGVTSPNIQRLGNTGRILLELPGAKDIERVKDLVTKTAQLQFWETYKTQEVLPYIMEVNQNMVEANKQKEAKEQVEEEVVDAAEVQDETSNAIDDLTGQIETDSTDVASVNPLGIQGYGNGGSVVGMFLAKDREKVMAQLNAPKNRASLPAEMRYARFVWGLQNEESEYSELYAVKGNRDGEPELSGAVITDARQDYDQLSRPAVSMQMDARGAKIWEEMTKKAYETQGVYCYCIR